MLKDETVNKRIFDAFMKEGADAWYADGAAERFLAGDYSTNEWTQVRDILDVWFDSGSTHAFCLEQREDLKWPADLYLEGSDQHRGWFHSSLLECCGTRGRAPYDAVLTHGFTMDEQGRKMSKSLNNSTAPQEVIKQSGADILRLWVASVRLCRRPAHRPGNPQDQCRCLSQAAQHTALDAGLAGAFQAGRQGVRRRHAGTGAADAVATLPVSMAWCARAMTSFDFRRIYSALVNFMTIELSSFYFDVRKDALYCDAPSSVQRRAALTVIDRIFDCMVSWLAPILAFTCDEAWAQRHGDEACVHTVQFPEVSASWRNQDLEAKWAKIMKVRSVVTGALEIERREKRIGSSLESAPVVYIADEDLVRRGSRYRHGRNLHHLRCTR